MKHTELDLTDKYFPVLDEGFCSLVDHMGSDEAIARSARCSYGKGTKSVSDDRGLIRTLMREKHMSPFEMGEIVFHIGMPIFCSRQMVRHRTHSMNEVSARYSVIQTVFYTPDEERHKLQSTSSKQGSHQNNISEAAYDQIRWVRDEGRAVAKELYENCLDAGLTREIARIDLPLSTYTYFYWKMDVRNLLGLLEQRLDSHAQEEIREYAKVMAGIVKELFPLTWEAFEDYRLNSMTFSIAEREALCILVGEHKCSEKEILDVCLRLNMSKRESEQFMWKYYDIFDGEQWVKRGEYLKPDYELDIENAKDFSHYESRVK